MHEIASDVVSIADACLGGLKGRSALLVGPEEQRHPYRKLLQRAGMRQVYQEDLPYHVAPILPYIQLLISMPRPVVPSSLAKPEALTPLLTAASVARGCDRRHTPLLIFDLSASTSVEELAGLLPAVCLYTPDDLHRILATTEARAS
jgi:glutamyl-tRNA reductase